MQITNSKYVCDICGRDIKYSANNKRCGIRIDERGILIRENSTGDVCEICRPLLRDELTDVTDRVRQKSLGIKPPVIVPNNIPKYVFFFIGDGMGYTHVKATENLLGVPLSFSSFPVQGSSTTYPANGENVVTDSAAAATALASGVKTLNYRLGLSPEGDRLLGIAYKYKSYGAKIGIATSVSIDHATPAGFYAGVEDRNMYYEIGSQIAGTGFDYFAGSGLLQPNKEPPGTYSQLDNAGYAVFTKNDLTAIHNFPKDNKMFLKQSDNLDQGSLEYYYNRGGAGYYGWELEDFVRVGIERLYSTTHNGFFFMVEGGKIDWSSHANNTLLTLYETQDFSNALRPALEFYQNHQDDTLIVVTADHETGNTILDDPDDWNIHWRSGDHSLQEVPVYAIGKNSELFNGDMDNTDIPKHIMNGNPL